MSLQDAQDALEMIEEARADGLAATLTFTRQGTGPGTFNPDTGMYEGGSSTITFTGVAVILPASQGTVEAFDVRFDGNSLLESRLRALLIAAHGMTHEPAPGDVVTFPDGKQGSLLGCTPLNPDGANPIIYQGTVRL